MARNIVLAIFLCGTLAACAGGGGFGDPAAARANLESTQPRPSQ